MADNIEKIKQLALMAMVSDDELMEIFVLKGGNALNLIYNITSRASIDLDFSIDKDFDGEQLDDVRQKIEKNLKKVFSENGYEAFDVTLVPKPEIAGADMPEWWGGYELAFKIVPSEEYQQRAGNIADLRRNAEIVGPNNKRKFTIDISKFEFCLGKTQREIKGYAIYVYTPAMIAFEKLRAICQQTKEYADQIGKSHHEGRARDFFDIYTIINALGVDLMSPENIQLCKNIFSAKEVPLSLIGKIRDYKEQHRADFPIVQQTIRPGVKIRDFDFYFDYVAELGDRLLKPLGQV
jgi:hypothetical protein